MGIDIVIVNYNATGYLLDCLSSIYQAMGDSKDARIIVFDNASIDGVGRIKHRFPKVELIRSPTNIGFAKAVNHAIRLGFAPYVLILNPDTCIRKPFFESMMDFMEAHPDAGILGPKIFDEKGRVQGSARTFPTAGTAFIGRTALLTQLFPNNRHTARQILARDGGGEQPMDVDWVTGACMLVRREAIGSVGMLDEHFFMYWEDADWCRRMQQNRWRVIYFPKSELVHFTGVSSRKNAIQASLEFHKSAYYLFCKSAGNSNRRFLKGFVFSALLLRAYIRIMMTMAEDWKRIW